MISRAFLLATILLVPAVATTGVWIDDADYADRSAIVDTPGWAVGVAVTTTHAYVADWSAGLQVIDIADPQQPRIVGNLATPGAALGIAVKGSHAYVADQRSGVQVIDVTNPMQPVIVAKVVTPGTSWGVAIDGNHAYIAAAESGLLVIDISNPATPRIVASVDTPKAVLGVTIRGDRAYAAGIGSGVCVVDITAPEHPRLIGHRDTPKPPRGVAVSGRWAYVADGSSGLRVEPVPSMADEILRDTSAGIAFAANEPPAVGRLAVHPNPFNPQTTITFALPQIQPVDIDVYDVTGQCVRRLAHQSHARGEHSLVWDGRDETGRALPSGTYVIRLQTGRWAQATKAMLIR